MYFTIFILIIGRVFFCQTCIKILCLSKELFSEKFKTSCSILIQRFVMIQWSNSCLNIFKVENVYKNKLFRKIRAIIYSSAYKENSRIKIFSIFSISLRNYVSMIAFNFQDLLSNIKKVIRDKLQQNKVF